MEGFPREFTQQAEIRDVQYEITPAATWSCGGELIVGSSHDASLLRNDNGDLSNGSSSIKSACVEVTPRWLNNLLEEKENLGGSQLALQNAKISFPRSTNPQMIHHRLYPNFLVY